MENIEVTRKRGVVKEFTRDAERRLVKAATGFFFSVGEGRSFWVTLHTRERDPEVAKFFLRRWVAAMRYRYGIHGVFCMEFDRLQYVHYHAVIALAPQHATATLTAVRGAAIDVWKGVAGQTHVGSCMLRPVRDLGDRSDLIRYMAKADDEFGNPHHKRWQKAVPVAFAARGIRALWWGYTGRLATAIHTPSPAMTTVSLPLAA